MYSDENSVSSQMISLYILHGNSIYMNKNWKLFIKIKRKVYKQNLLC